jgi:hypothetical protein
MRHSRIILFSKILRVSLSATAQDRFEVFGEYSYLHFSRTITGLNSRSFNGGGGGASVYFLKIRNKGRLHGIWQYYVHKDPYYASSHPGERNHTGGYLHLAGRHVHLFVRPRAPDTHAADQALRRSTVWRIKHECLCEPVKVECGYLSTRTNTQRSGAGMMLCSRLS